MDPATDGLQRLAVDGLEPGTWAWEVKTANLHRGILRLDRGGQVGIADLSREVRDLVSRIYRISWWKGFAFGVLLHVDGPLRERPHALADCIDRFNRSAGVWQWIVAVDRANRSAYACHTWMAGALHPAFESTAEQLRRLGYEVELSYVDRPATFASVERIMRGLGHAAFFVSVLGLLALCGGALVLPFVETDLRSHYMALVLCVGSTAAFLDQSKRDTGRFFGFLGQRSSQVRYWTWALGAGSVVFWLVNLVRVALR